MLVSIPQESHSHSHGQWGVDQQQTGDMRQAASPLAPGERYPPGQYHRTQQVPQDNRIPSRTPSQDQDQIHRINPAEDDIRTPKTRVIMTGNGYFIASAGGLAKSKSGPDHHHRFSSSPSSSAVPGSTPRGFRETFMSSMSHTPPPRDTSSASPLRHQGHGMMNRNEISKTSSPSKEKDVMNANNAASNPTNASPGKKWSFGGLFKRKVKAGGTNGNGNGTASTSHGNVNPQPHQMSPLASVGLHNKRTSSPMSGAMSHSSPSPSTLQQGKTHHLGPNAYSNAYSPTVIRGNSGGNKYVSTPTQTRHKGKLSESDVTSDDSELEESQNQSQSQSQPSSFKQNFLTRRLSRRKEKAAAKKKAAEEANLLKVPKLENGRRVGSSPDSLNNGTNGNTNGKGAWPSWEITKKVPQLLPVNNYSESSGSLSLSQEGSSNKGSRAMAKEAVKARAVARRESFLQDSSSEDEDRSRSSIQGSHSSLTVRQAKRRPLSTSLNGTNGNVQMNNYQQNPNQPQQSFRPMVDYQMQYNRASPSSPARFDRQNNNSSSPNLHLQRRAMPPPGSPRWEARVVYQQENHENETPFVVKLPPQQRPPSGQGYTVMSNGEVLEDQQQQVITAGLRVPIAPSVGQGHNGQQIVEEVHYANLPKNPNFPYPHPFRSSTPVTYANVNASPPPPPPRRLMAGNQNFYRPVSCSYLDSFQGGYPYSNGQRNASPNSPLIMNHQYGERDSRTPQRPSPPRNQNFQNPYPYEDQVDNVRENNNFLTPNNMPFRHHPQQNNLHPSLIRSPSEPPEIKVQYARESPLKRNAATPTPTMQAHYYNDVQPVVTSKLGFPVRKLQDAGRIPLPQSPVHMKASEFWRKKEAEATGNPVQPNLNHRLYMNRIRSADSSPLPVRRIMRESPAAIQNSNESISSLSSFSAEAQSPHMFGGHVPIRHGAGGIRKIQNAERTQGHNPSGKSTTPNGTHFSSSAGYNNASFNKMGDNFRNPGQEMSQSVRENQSATQRLHKVRNPSCPETKTESNKLRSLVELNNGKTPGRNLEDALNELEDMYKSLRLSDEDLLDRAERRDLPTPHQELRNAPLIPLPQSYHYQPLVGSVESLATGSSSGSGGTTYSSDNHNPNRQRAPPLRRSARPDTVHDDMAKRRCHQQDVKPMDPRDVVSQTGSYMVLSPAFSPPVSPCPPETYPHQLMSLSHFGINQDEPDLTLDDVTFRQYRKANAIRIIDPQPLFGIPLGPITAAPGSDYLHSKRSDRLRPLFKATKNPDLVNDDIAFRNLRKDLNSDNNNLSKDWTPRLFSPTRDTAFSYNLSPDERNKKLRAIRSLSANITNYVPFTELQGDMGKWRSFTDLHRGNQPQRGSSGYRRPSWVEQIENSEFLSGSNNKFFPPEPEHWERKLPRKTVELTSDLYDPNKLRRPWTDIILDSFEKKKQEEIERIAQEAAAAAANANVNSDGINDSSKALLTPQNNGVEIAEDDDEVFLDARDKSKSTSPEEDRTTHKIGYATNYANANSQNQGASQFPLLLGQNTRRGSWVEPRSSSSFLLSASECNLEEDRRRKSWSDMPKDQQEKLFNPLPPPRKIKQINVGFGPSNPHQFSEGSSVPIEGVNYLTESIESDIPKAIERLQKGEAELNALMDLLIAGAETCGPSPASTSPANMRDIKTTDVNVSLSSDSRIESEFKHIPATLDEKLEMMMTQKDSLERRKKKMPVPKIPPKESQIDEPTKKTRDNDNLSKQREKILLETPREYPPAIVSVSRKQQQGNDSKDKPTERRRTTNESNDNNNARTAITMTGPNLPQNYTSSSVVTTTRVNLPSNSNDNDTSSSPKGVLKESIKSSRAPSSSSSPKELPSSIDELIDSINESLPELEAGCGVKLSNKNGGSSSISSTGSGSPPSIPSPRAGSPRTIMLTRKHSSSDQGDNNESLTEEGRSPNNEDEDEITVKLSNTSSTSSTVALSQGQSGTRRSSQGSNPEHLEDAGPSFVMRKKSAEEEDPNGKGSKQGSGRTKSQGQRNQSLSGESVSSSPSTGSEAGDGTNKKEKDKSHKRKSHLNRAFTDEPVPDIQQSSFDSIVAPINKDKPPKLHELLGNLERRGGSDRVEINESVGGKRSSICKVPAIPPILTTNNHASSTELGFHPNANSNPNTCISDSSDCNRMSKSSDNSIRPRQLPRSPSMKLKSSNILEKVQSFEFQSQPGNVGKGPLVKRDSFSDAEGVSFIKKLLQKEKTEKQREEPFLLKKSPSVGSTPVTKDKDIKKEWTHAHPNLFKKFFQKKGVKKGEGEEGEGGEGNHENENETDENGKAGENETGDSHGGEDSHSHANPEEEEEALAISTTVAQKASFFMKLEHEQRFSKWRKNSLDGTGTPSSPFPSQSGPKINSGGDAGGNGGRSWSRQHTQPITTTEVMRATSNNNISEVQDTRNDNDNDPLREDGRKGEDGLSEQNNSEPFQLSLKDRVHMFDKIMTVGSNKAPQMMVPSHIQEQSKSGFQITHSTSAATFPFSQGVPVTALKMHPILSNNVPQKSAFSHRRGSTSDIEFINNTVPTKPPSPLVKRRHEKTQSMYVSADDLSEDGEVSSGGQEVAEIISKSYENSPVARKKSWKSQQKHQAAHAQSFTKEIWRRCRVNEGNWSNNPKKAQFPQQTYRVTTNVTHTIIKGNPVQKADEADERMKPQQSKSSSKSPPETSNLLQILTVLTSPNDELDENKGDNVQKLMPLPRGDEENGSSISTADNGNLNSSGVSRNSQHHHVHVPHLDDESFQLFFGTSVSVTKSETSSNPLSALSNDGESRFNLSGEANLNLNADPEMNAVRRESDLLVMKKNVPLVRRKSSGKSRNPMKALAARIDFRNQWYTDETKSEHENS